MLTEKEIQKYESLVQLYLQHESDSAAHVLAHVLQSHRELQAENARLREPLTQIGEENAVRN